MNGLERRPGLRNALNRSRRGLGGGGGPTVLSRSGPAPSRVPNLAQMCLSCRRRVRSRFERGGGTQRVFKRLLEGFRPGDLVGLGSLFGVGRELAVHPFSPFLSPPRPAPPRPTGQWTPLPAPGVAAPPAAAAGRSRKAECAGRGIPTAKVAGPAGRSPPGSQVGSR